MDENKEKNNAENNGSESNNAIAMTRKDFLKKGAIAAAAVAFLGKAAFDKANAAVVTDNLDAKGTHIGAAPPANTTMTWVDTAHNGIMKYFNGADWMPIGQGIILKGTLAAGATSASFTNAEITSTSVIDVYTDKFGVDPKAQSISGNTLTLTFTARTTATNIMIIVRRGM